MNIFYYSKFSNQSKWLTVLRKKFKGQKIFTIKDNFDYQKIDIALVWKMPNTILKKLTNIKIIFSLGAGVDHIINLPNYTQTPIIRIKDPNMQARMFNHTLSQILTYQLKLISYHKAQQNNIWLSEKITPLNNEITIGILGLGYLGEYIAKKLIQLDYKVIGYKKDNVKSKKNFRIFIGKKIDQFISSSDILVSILPSTKHTEDFINIEFLKKMKKNSLLINIGRGLSLNEDDLLSHLRLNNNFYVSLDVFKKEPLNKNHKFWSHPNITITPHIAAITDIESSVNYMYRRFLKINNKARITSDVNLAKGY